MNDQSSALAKAGAAELAGFCFHKLASLEARFIALCYRAEAAGIECSDLVGVEVRSLDEVATPRLAPPTN